MSDPVPKLDIAAARKRLDALTLGVKARIHPEAQTNPMVAIYQRDMGAALDVIEGLRAALARLLAYAGAPDSCYCGEWAAPCPLCDAREALALVKEVKRG